jgi:hypothetical protein
MTYQIENLKKLSKIELGTGDRLVRVIAKKGMIGKKRMESQGVIIPAVSVSMLNALVNSEVGREYLCGAVAGVQDALVRRAVEAGKMALFAEQFDLDAIEAAMRAANESGRFSKESIKVWFDEYLRDPLAAAIRAKMGAIADDKVEKLCGNYLASFQLLAGRDPTMSNAVKAGLIRALEFLPEDHDTVTGNEVATRLATVQEASEVLAAL